MYKKNKLSVLCTMLALCILLSAALAGCGGDTVSENAQTVIHTIMDCPNPELWSEDAATILGVEISDEEKAARKAKEEEIRANWEEAVGHCFSPGSFDSFYCSAAATYFHGSGNTYEVKSMSLVEKSDTLETVSVVLLENGQEISLTVELYINPDGLFYQVGIPDLY